MSLDPYARPWERYSLEREQWEARSPGLFVVATKDRVMGPFQSMNEAIANRRSINEPIAGIFKIGEQPRTEEVVR
jgi:hypothetical protein